MAWAISRKKAKYRVHLTLIISSYAKMMIPHCHKAHALTEADLAHVFKDAGYRAGNLLNSQTLLHFAGAIKTS